MDNFYFTNGILQSDYPIDQKLYSKIEPITASEAAKHLAILESYRLSMQQEGKEKYFS